MLCVSALLVVFQSISATFLFIVAVSCFIRSIICIMVDNILFCLFHEGCSSLKHD